jgi:predicted lipoprotein with Yx(FWY)xxD motif
MKRSVAAAACVTFSLAMVACGTGDEDAQGPDSASADAASSALAGDAAREQRKSSKGSSVKVMNSRYGRMLYDGRGRALYLFTRERTSRSRCYGECAAAWPPFLTRRKPQARSGVKSSLLGTTRRRDRRTQVTYRGHPLYHYMGDRQPGQVLCQDVNEFGGTWLVVSPSGTAIR